MELPFINTTDIKDIDHFNELAKTKNWWADDCVLVLMNKCRVPFVLNAVKTSGLIEEDSLKALKVLDVGCGAGILSEELVKLGADVTGLDAGDEVINLAKLHASTNDDINKNKLNYVCSTIEEFCKNHKNTFDVVVASEIIEHVLNPDLFLSCCLETLKPNCPIIITTINRTWQAKLKAVFFYEYVLNIIPRGTHDWNKFITPEELQDMFKNYDCEPKTIEGIGLNWRQMKFEATNSTSVFYMAYAVKNK